MGKRKLLWISDGMNINTGYGIQTKGILEGLKDDFEVYHLSFQYHGQPITLNGIVLLPNGYDMWANDIIDAHMENIKPDIVITLMDLFRPFKLLTELKEFKKKYPATYIAYYPLDAKPTPFGTENVFESFDRLVAMSDFGYDVLLKERGIKSDIRIWMGIDTNVFKPIPSFKRIPILENKFVIGSVFRNIARKNPSALLFAYKRFLKMMDNPEKAMMYLHTDPNDRHGMNIAGLINRLGLQSKILFTKIHSVFYSVPPEKLNEIYNNFDIHTLSTTGEGFGLPIIESMAVGLPNVVTDYTTTKELIGETRGIRVPYDIIPTQCTHLTERAYIKVEDMAKAFLEMYNLWKNGELIPRYKSHCITYAKENFDWQIIQNQWRKYLNGI